MFFITDKEGPCRLSYYFLLMTKHIKRYTLLSSYLLRGIIVVVSQQLSGNLFGGEFFINGKIFE
jgi:hypothetical protein